MNYSRTITWIVVAALSWYGMMAVHEAGHCLGALATGATIEAVKIPVIGFSRTDFSKGDCPLFVVWAGPLLGATMPVVLLALLRAVGARARHALQFFVGFCLLANGAYIGLGAFSGAGDCRQLAQHGSPGWTLVAFGVLSFGGGLYVWHRMGPLRNWFASNSRTGFDPMRAG
ncbi:MAG: hypothetical protein HN742_38405 [Lentisphaerae bacterium]|jgi:hypothetical protein|nr:hypothetical protein [Lentisphaerota bacterium]MBT4815807.1 hypothetical protein [Lentisphaerota bacterium]MBT5609289.1 hypothetical protein [Lentisphaerota bacterium]MBT7059417.1 hypothetical protein [Lentisphaerota bacterium]MBT7847801.1 hypothetical protein [Lentisphaerota bacterium]